MNCQVCQQPRGGLLQTGNWISCGVCRATQDLVSAVNTCRVHPSREAFLISQIRNLTGEVRESCWPLPQTQPLILVKGGYVAGPNPPSAPPFPQNGETQAVFTSTVGTASKAAGPKLEVKEELHSRFATVDSNVHKPDTRVPTPASSSNRLQHEGAKHRSDSSESRSSCSRGETELCSARRLEGKRGKKNKGRRRETWFKDKLGDKGFHRVEGDQPGPRWRREGVQPPSAQPRQSHPPSCDRRRPHDPTNRQRRLHEPKNGQRRPHDPADRQR